MLPILKSPLSFYFLDVQERERASLDGMRFFEEEEALRVWTSLFDPRSSGLYDLPDDSWIVRANWTSIGNWIECYNGKANWAAIFESISSLSGWKSASSLIFVQNSKTIVSASYELFIAYADALLAACDDGPLLLNSEGENGCVFRFAPIGTLQHAIRK